LRGSKKHLHLSPFCRFTPNGCKKHIILSGFKKTKVSVTVSDYILIKQKEIMPTEIKEKHNLKQP